MMSALETNFGPTPSQTVGPFFAYGLTAAQYQYDFDQPFDSVVARPLAKGTHIVLEGRVIDGDGKPVPDALIEISHPDSAGKYPATVEEAKAQGFRAFGRVGTGTDPDNRYVFQTLKPGSLGATQAPHINVIVLMRGLLLHAFTRVYFSDEEKANAADPVLASVPADRRQTLVAQRVDKGGQVVYTFDIHMQGEKETVFFDV